MMGLYGVLIFAAGYLAAFVTIWTVSWIEMDKTDAARRRAGYVWINNDWVHSTDPRLEELRE